MGGARDIQHGDATDIAPARAYARLTGDARATDASGTSVDFAEQLGAIVWEYDIFREVYTYISPAIERWLGVSRERLYTEPGLWFQLAHPDDSEWAHAFCVASTTECQDHDFEYRMIDADGHIIWLRDIVSVVLDHERHPVGLVGVFVDMTDHHRLQDEATQAAREFHAVFSLLKGLFFRLDAHDMIVHSSASSASMFGEPLVEVVGSTVSEVLPVVVADSIRRGTEAIGLGDPSFVDEILVGEGEGRRLIELSLFPLHRNERALIVRDISDRLEAREHDELHNRQLKTLASEVERIADRERRRLAEEIHDRVSQTLAIARMELLSCEKDGAQERASRIRGLVEQAAREARALTSELAPTGLYELGLVPAVSMLCESLEQQYAFRCTIDDRLPARVQLDEDTAAFAFRATRELLMNVIKHAGVDSAEVRISLDDEMLRVTVRDHGAGAYLNPSAWQPGAEGGFGLFSLLERAQALGGDLDIRSRPGAGTVAVVSVPVSG